jgi:predicted outer membrane repeat protein
VTTRPARGSAFAQRRVVRVTSGLASVGVLAGISLLGAGPASAATAADCTLANTVDATALPIAGTSADIQDLLNANEPIICIRGTILLTGPLVATADVSLFGLDNAVLDGASAYRILNDPSYSHAITAENLRFTNGRGVDGAAIRAITVNVIGSTFDHNVATAVGGAIRTNTFASDHSTFEDNSATGFGGGAVWFDGTATVTSSTFRRNTVTDRGGAIASYGVLTIASSTFEDNSAVQTGGAVSVGTSVSASNSTFARNSVSGGNSVGGAIYTGTVTSVNSTFVENTSGDWAGAIYSGRASVTQSTFLNNYAPDGLSVWGRGGPLSTYAGNIFASTTPGQHIADYDGADATDLGGNVFSSALGVERGFVAPQPSTLYSVTPATIFGASVLADNGGEVETLALPTGSPAIDLVPAGSLVTTDARTWTRVAANDSGAYEFGAVNPALPPPPPPPGGGSGGALLPPTGAEIGWLGTLAAALLGAGAAVAAWSLRTSRRQPRRASPRS